MLLLYSLQPIPLLCSRELPPDAPLLRKERWSCQYSGPSQRDAGFSFLDRHIESFYEKISAGLNGLKKTFFDEVMTDGQLRPRRWSFHGVVQGEAQRFDLLDALLCRTLGFPPLPTVFL